MKHTEGKWKTVNKISLNMGHIIQIMSGTTIIATVHANGEMSKEERDTNAELICQAPYLAARNKELVEHLTRILDRIKECNLQDNFPSAFARAQAALNNDLYGHNEARQSASDAVNDVYDSARKNAGDINNL